VTGNGQQGAHPGYRRRGVGHPRPNTAPDGLQRLLRFCLQAWLIPSMSLLQLVPTTVDAAGTPSPVCARAAHGRRGGDRSTASPSITTWAADLPASMREMGPGHLWCEGAVPVTDPLSLEVGALHMLRWTGTLAVSITSRRSRRTQCHCRRCAHNVLLLGTPGAGTSMLARRLTTILPTMTLAEALETTRIHRVAGRTGDRTAVVTTRPFRAPHQTLSDAGLIGGGQVPMPGEVSLAYRHIRTLDELSEFRCWRPARGSGRLRLWGRVLAPRWQPPGTAEKVGAHYPEVVVQGDGLAARSRRAYAQRRRGPVKHSTPR
jgi:hypothetical protein